MAFDAGMMRAVVWEINRAAKDARVEKIQQPQKDEVVITLHSAAQRSDLRLSINAGANNPKLGFTAVAKENPAAAPMLCMLLRKQLGGGKLVQARQIGFDRVCELEFASRDEMGFAVTRYLIVEIMGKYSNLLLADENKKIITALHLVDFSTSRLRQILPGMTYELPPAQDKADLFTTDCPTLAAYLAAADASLPLHKFILGRFLGISPLVARELAFRVTGRTDTPVGEVRTDALFAAFADFIRIFAEHDYAPTLVYGEDDTPGEFCFTERVRKPSGFRPSVRCWTPISASAISPRRSNSAGRTSFICCRMPMRVLRESWTCSARNWLPATRGRPIVCTATSSRRISIT